MRLAVPAPFGVGTVFFCANSEETFHRARTNGTLRSIAAVRSIAPKFVYLSQPDEKDILKKANFDGVVRNGRECKSISVSDGTGQ